MDCGEHPSQWVAGRRAHTGARVELKSLASELVKLVH